MRVVSHPEADDELEAIALWYEQRQPGLGDDFLDEFERTLREIVVEPGRWRRIRGENRKHSFHRFPHAIVYSVSVGTLYIKAVMDIEEADDEALFDVRSKQPDGTSLRDVLCQVNGPDQL